MLPATFLFSSCALTAPLEPEVVKTRPLENYEAQWRIDLPDGVETIATSNIFAIPGGDVSELLFSRRNLPRAREIISSGLTRAVRLHQLGERYWMSAEMPPSTVWPLLKQYWGDNGGIEQEDPSQGLLRSGPTEQQGGSAAFLLQVESGLRSGSTEVMMWPLNAEGQVVENPALVEERFRSVLDFLGRVTDITSSMLVQHLDFQAKMVTGVDDRGFPQIEIRTDERRAWALLTRAVQRLELDVIGTDSRRQLIEFNYRQRRRRTAWQPRWPEQAWQDKAGLAPLRTGYRPKVRPDAPATFGKEADVEGDLERVYLKLDYSDELSTVRLVDHRLSVNTAFELVSQLVQEIQ